MNVLNALGLPLSDDLMPPTEFNEKGYFESWTISKIHDDILRAFGLTWAIPTTVRPLPPQWWHSPAVAQPRQQLVELVSREFEKAGLVWGFKDPRTARLMPLWKGIIDELGLEAKYVLVSRHPRDCVRSLQTREKMNPIQGELLWLEHTADAVGYTGAKLDALVEYDRWFDDGVPQAEYLIEKLGLVHPGKERLSEMVSSIVSADLRHSLTTEAVYELPFTLEFNDAVQKRDVGRLELLANLFTATRQFSQKVVGLCTQELVGRLNDTARIANERGQRIAALEARLSVAEGSR
ncbi:MAG TPA: hypothetical protein VFE36_04885 [Candidatus Baltobacteraceae bacterium]|jgi:hypothetical protein|nr:hypothetical protein [Candidatus Baltobacteraceae bacterium]